MSWTLGPRAKTERRAARIAIETLPSGVFRQHRSLFYVTGSTAKGQVWHNLGKQWNDEARERWKAIVLQHRSANYAKKHVYTEAGGGPIPTEFLREMLTNARKNAKSRGHQCTLTIDELQDHALRTRGRCELTGIKFEFGQAKELADSAVRRKRIWAPSLDRIDGTLGYAASNVRIVCMAVNAARQEFGDEVLMKVAAGLMKHRDRRLISSAIGPQTRAVEPAKTSAILAGAPRETSTGAGCSPKRTSDC